MTPILFILLAFFPRFHSITANELMDLYRSRQAAKESFNSEKQWRQAMIDSAPPIGYVAGKPIHSRIWDRVQPGEKIFVDENGVPYQYRPHHG